MSSSVSSIKEQLSVARSRLSQVVSTDSLKGAVKTAINQKVSNYQIPLLDNYDNALDSIVNRYEGMITLFKETVGETNDSAIINTEYLERIKQRMKDPIEGLAQISARTQSIYADISDIISLTNPSLNDVNTTYANAQKSLDETIENMGVFNQTVADSGIADLLAAQNQQLFTLKSYSSAPYTSLLSRDYYRSTAFKDDVAEYTQGIYSRGRKVKLQNQLAKQLAESKYSGKVASARQKEISTSQICETFGLSLPEKEEVAEYIKSLGEAIITYRGAKIFLNGIEITMDNQGRMRWGDKFVFKSSTTHLYKHGRNFQNASGINLKNYHYSGDLQGIARMKEMGNAGWSGFKESVNPLNDFKGWREVGKVGKIAKGAGAFLTALNIYGNFVENVDMSDGISAKEARDFVIDSAVDIGSGAAAAGLGAAIGSAFLPPLGTIVGAAAGIGVNLFLNNFEFGGKSIVDHTKNITKGIGDGIGNLVSLVFGG